MKQNILLLFFSIYGIINTINATHHHIFITAIGVSQSGVAAPYGDTVTIHASQTYPIKQVGSRINWLQGDVSGTGSTYSSNYTFTINSSIPTYYVCTTQTTFKFCILKTEYRNSTKGIRTEPCPIQSVFAPLKIYVDTILVERSPNAGYFKDSTYLWAWFSGSGGVVASTNGSWGNSTPGALMQYEGNGIYSYTVPNLANWFGVTSTNLFNTGYFGILPKHKDGGPPPNLMFDGAALLDICSASRVINTENKVEKMQQIRVFPNPTNDFLKLDFENISGANVLIFNTIGQQCDVQYLPIYENQITTRNLPKGLYIGQVKDKNFRFKFIKN